jgi:hypothetical protein
MRGVMAVCGGEGQRGRTEQGERKESAHSRYQPCRGMLGALHRCSSTIIARHRLRPRYNTATLRRSPLHHAFGHTRQHRPILTERLDMDMDLHGDLDKVHLKLTLILSPLIVSCVSSPFKIHILPFSIQIFHTPNRT